VSTGGSVPYRLRPNKAVDRELFISLLLRLGPALKLENYEYIGMGGPFLDDFRLVHSRIGIDRMTCVESDANVHRRQLFNRPVESVKCVYANLDDYLDEEDLVEPVIIWFDYTHPKKIVSQISRFSQSIGTVPLYSILKITLNANPGSLGTPPPESASNDALFHWRLDKFKDKMGSFCPNFITFEGMKSKQYGRSILCALKIAVEQEVLKHAERKVVWALSTHYADGQAMVTATIIVCEEADTQVESLVQEWSYCSAPTNPLPIDLPVLSAFERLTIEADLNAHTKLNYSLPVSPLAGDPLTDFRKFYRIYPHFSRVEL
jgi:hypothetical protein